MVPLHQSAVSLVASVLAYATAVSGSPVGVVSEVVAASPPPIPRNAVEVVPAAPRDLRTRSTSLMKRDANATFDLGFEVQNQVLFDGPSLNLDIPLKLECVDCRTWGSVEIATYLPDDIDDIIGDLTDLDLFNEAKLSLVFNGVGAFIDLDVVTNQMGAFTIPLLPPTETPLGVAGPNFQLGVVFFVEIALGITGEVDANSGFQLSIPDGSAFTMPLDPSVANTADFDGTMFSLLPLAVEAPANVTVALRLRVQAGLEFTGSDLLSAQALAGAYLNIPEVILGEGLSLGGNTTSSPSPSPDNSSSTCALPAFANVNINAGVFIDVGADVGLVQLGDFNPTASTTFFQAAVSTCLDDLAGAPASSTLIPSPSSTATTAPPPCPTDLVTETMTTASMVALTSCAIPVINCPANMTQVVMAEQTQTYTATSCPVPVTDIPTTVVVTVSTTVCPESTVAAPTATATATATSTSTSESAVMTGVNGAVMLTKLPAPITSALVVDPAVTPPPVPTVTGSVCSDSSSSV